MSDKLNKTEIIKLSKAITQKAKNYIKINDHVFATLVEHVLISELQKIDKYEK